MSEPLWPQNIEIIGCTGEFASGKTLFALTIAPGVRPGTSDARTKVYDTEKSSGSYQGLKFDRVSIPDVMAKLKPAGYKPIDTFTWWWDDVKKTAPGRYDVIVIDTISEIEDGLVEWVGKNPTYFGHSSGQYLKMSGIMWGDVKSLWKTILSDVSSRCQTFVFCAHMANVWAADKPTGKRKAKGKETLMELASLYLEMERKPDKNGVVPAKPSAILKKSRLTHMTLDENGDPKIVPCLPPRIPVCTPAEIRKYMNTPPDPDALKPEERAPEERLSADERAFMSLQQAEAERDAERMRLEVMNQRREMSKEVRDAKEVAAKDAAAAVGVPTPSPGGPLPEQLQKLFNLRNALFEGGMSPDGWRDFVAPYGVQKASELTPSQADEVIATAHAALAKVEADKAAAAPPPG